MRLISAVALVAIGLSATLPTSAVQSINQCDLAKEQLASVIQFDNDAVSKGHMICGTPRLKAEHRVRYYCRTDT